MAVDAHKMCRRGMSHTAFSADTSNDRRPLPHKLVISYSTVYGMHACLPQILRVMKSLPQAFP